MAGLVAILIAFDSFVFEEFRLKYQQIDEQVEQAQQDLSWMKQAVKQLPTQKGASRQVNPGRVVSYIDKQISRQGLKKNMQQMTPIKNHSARLRLSEVEFSKLLKFFAAIEGSVTLEEVRLLPTDNSGYVNASLLISNGEGR